MGGGHDLEGGRRGPGGGKPARAKAGGPLGRALAALGLSKEVQEQLAVLLAGFAAMMLLLSLVSGAYKARTEHLTGAAVEEIHTLRRENEAQSAMLQQAVEAMRHLKGGEELANQLEKMAEGSADRETALHHAALRDVQERELQLVEKLETVTATLDTCRVHVSNVVQQKDLEMQDLQGTIGMLTREVSELKVAVGERDKRVRDHEIKADKLSQKGARHKTKAQQLEMSVGWLSDKLSQKEREHKQAVADAKTERECHNDIAALQARVDDLQAWKDEHNRAQFLGLKPKRP